MKLPRWLNTAQADALAADLATEFTHNFPANASAASDRKGSQKLSHAVEVIGNRAAKFNGAHRMGWFRKARFMNSIKRRLLEKGHDEQLVDRVVYAIAVRMAR